MRKGYTLVELIVIIGILAIISFPLSQLFRILASNIPRNVAVVSTQSNIQRALGRIAMDMDRGLSLPLAFEQVNAGENTLLIELPEGVAFYRFKDDKITRRILAPQAGATNGHESPKHPIRTSIRYSTARPQRAITDPNQTVEISDPNQSVNIQALPEGENIGSMGRDIMPYDVSFPSPGRLDVSMVHEPNSLSGRDPNMHIQNDPNLPILDGRTTGIDPNEIPISKPSQPAVVEPAQPSIEDIIPGKLTNTWLIPDGRITAELLLESNEPYAVAIKSRIEYKYQGANYTKWKSAHLFFLNIAGGLTGRYEGADETNK